MDSLRSKTLLVLLASAVGLALHASDIVSAVPPPVNVDLFDDFNRPNGNTVGMPSSGGTQPWAEYESAPDAVRISGSSVWLRNTAQGRERMGYDMTGKYPLAFDEATEDMSWAFNMRSNRDDPSGFDANQYGGAVVLGCNEQDFTDPDAYGYAVVLGGGSPVAGERPIRLVRFSGGLTLNSNITDIAVVAPADDSSFFAVNVTYDSCSHTWTLDVREETQFTQPSLGVFPLSANGVDDTFTAVELPFLGTLWNHGTINWAFRVDNIYIPKAGIATDNVYTWNGGTGDFDVPSNWTPTRICARNRDVLIFDGGVSVVHEVPNQTIGRMRLQNNATVSLMDPSADALPSTLTLTGGPGDDLSVPAGCTLVFDVVNTVGGNGIFIDMLATTTGVIGGTLRFDNTGSNPGGRYHRLAVTDPDAVHVLNGGRVEALQLLNSFHPFGDDRGTDAVVFESGSIYLHASGANPFGYAQPNSKVVLQPGSWYEFTYAAGIPSMSGRTYANFKYDVAAVKGMGGLADYFIDTLLVSQGTLNFELDATATIAGDVETALGATLAFVPLSSGIINVDATVTQNILGAGTMTIGGNAVLNLQNQQRINILKDISVAGVAHVVSNAVVDFEGDNALLGSGTAGFQPDATVYLGSTSGINAAGGTGNVRTNARNFSGQTAYVYDGTADQITGTGLPTVISGNGRLEIDNPGNTVTLTNTGTTVTPKLTLTNGLFALGATNTVAIANAGSVESASGNFAPGNLAGTVSFLGTGTVAAVGNLDFWNVVLPPGSGGLDFGPGGSPFVHHELVIGSGRYVENNGPYYANASTLVYNTDGPFTAGTEWYANTVSGRGVPHDVQVGRAGTNNTALNFGSSNAWRLCRGDMRIGDAGGGAGFGFFLSTTAGGDLHLEGDFIVRANGVFGANQRAVSFVGAGGDQTITSHAAGNAVDFAYLIVDKPLGDLLLGDGPATTASAIGGNGGNVLVLSGGDLDLRGQTFNLDGTSSSKFLVANGNRKVKSTTAANFNFVGDKVVISSNSGALIFENNVTVNIAAGVDFGFGGLTVINATLQINAGGFAQANAPFYGPQGVLKYNTGANPYLRRVEWSGSEGTVGYPNDVIVAGNTILNPGGDPINNNTGTDFGARRDVIIESGSAIYMDYGGDDMTVPLKVGRNLIIDGDLSASDVAGGDIHVGGNWLRGPSGVFNPNDRQVLFNGGIAQNITAPGGETFDYLAFDSAGTKTLNDDIAVNKNLDILSLSGALTPGLHTIALSGNWDNQAGTAAFDEAVSTVRFVGSASQSLQTVSVAEDFQNLDIDNSGGGLQLDNTIGIAGQLTFVDGLIHTGINRVDFGNAAIHTGSGDASYINGFARKTGFVANSEFKFPVGQHDATDPLNPIDVYQPAALIPTSTSATAAFTVDYQHHNQFPGTYEPGNLPPMTAPLIKVSTCDYWNIDRTSPGTDAKVKLHWSDACLDISDLSALVVAKVNGGQWENRGQSAVLATLPYDFGFVVSNVVSSFSPFAIGSTSAVNVLPVELLSFTARAKDALVETKWSTASETNNAYFVVERSVDAENFEEVGRVAGAGFSTSRLDYAFTDDAPYVGISYYRLRQTDFDGAETHSVVRAVKMPGDADFALLKVYRMGEGVRLVYRSDAARLGVEVFDMRGKKLYSSRIDAVNGSAVVFPSLARGIYVLTLRSGKGVRRMKFFY